MSGTVDADEACDTKASNDLQALDWRSRIVADANVLAGKPVIKGTRISVELVMDLLAAGYTPEQIRQQYDHLTLDDIHEIMRRGDMTIHLFKKDTNQRIGAITEAELKVLADALEEESPTDNDYFITQATIDLIGDGRASDHLLHLLRAAVGSGEGIEVRWERHDAAD